MAKPKYGKWIEPEGLIKITGWARDGLTDENIAHNMGIAICTLYAWCKDHPDISKALKSGKEVVDRIVENALYKNAIGYEYDETTIEKDMDGNVRSNKVVHKVMKPDTTAQIFWLKNRKPQEWRDKRETEISGKDGGAINVQNITDAEIDKRIASIESKMKEKK